MKKICFNALFLLLVIASAKAQGWAISDKVQVGHSWLIGNRPGNTEYAFQPSVAFGRSAIYNFGPYAGIGFGTFFSTEGGSFKYDNDNIADKAVQRMNYFRVPVFANFTFGDPAARVRPRLGIGGSVGFLVGGKTFILNEEDAFVGSKSTKVMGTKVDAGATALLGFSVRVADGFTINHDVNYYHGLVTNNYDDNSLPPFTHRNISLGLGFTITSDAMRRWKNKMMNGNHGGQKFHRAPRNTRSRHMR